MADSFYCAENSLTCFDDIDCNGRDEIGLSPSLPHQNNQTHNQGPCLDPSGSESLMDVSFPLQCEERLRAMIERESDHLPRDDYLKSLRSGDLDLSVRREALDWILKAHAYYNFGPLSICLSMNYLDRFLSVYQFPKGKSWTVQLLSVACLSLAAKMEETEVPQSVDLQVGEPKFVFEAKTIQRMELLVLSTLKWRMQAITPCSFIDYFLSKITINKHPATSKSLQLILSMIRGIDFLEFRPSEIAAAAVAISISREMQAVEVEKAISCFEYIEKGRVMKCVELIRNLSLISGSGNDGRGGTGGGSASVPSIPQSPVGVLDAAIASLSYKSDELTTVGSCANSSQNSPDNKRRKPITSDVDF